MSEVCQIFLEVEERETVNNMVDEDTAMGQLIDKAKSSVDTDVCQKKKKKKLKAKRLKARNLNSVQVNNMEDEDTAMDEIQNISLGDTSAGSKNSLEPPLYIGLMDSLEAFRKEAKSVADEWTDKKAKFNDRRSFDTFKWLLDISGLDWHNYVSGDYDLNVCHQLDTWSPSLQAPSIQTPLCTKLTSDTNWIKATRYFHKSLSLKQLLLGISGDEFRQNQARLLVSFLDHLIMIQQEQRVVAYGIFEHLEQVRRCCAASLRAVSSKVADGYGDGDKCPFTPFKHPMDYYMCQQKHLFDSLHIMSRESAWWLRKFEASNSSNDLLVQQFLEIIMLFVPKFKNAKDSLDQYLLDTNCPFIEDTMKQLDLQNREILDDFERRIKDLPKLLPGDDIESGDVEEGDDREPVTRELLGCFAYTVNEGKIILDKYRADRSTNISSSLKSAFDNSSSETVRLIQDVVLGIKFAGNNLANKGLPLGCITYWRVLFETPLHNLKLDLLCQRIGETTNLAVKLLNSDAGGDHSGVEYFFSGLRLVIDDLLLTADRYLLEFVAMHKTVAEITYMLGDAFTTGGAGMRDMSDETLPGPLSKNDKQMPAIIDFPWDDHNVRDDYDHSFQIYFNDPQTQFFNVNLDYGHGPDSDSEFV